MNNSEPNNPETGDPRQAMKGMTETHNQPDLLYHFTAEINLPLILQQGIKPPLPLKETEVNGVPVESLGVWLTSDPDPVRQQWSRMRPFNQVAVRRPDQGVGGYTANHHHPPAPDSGKIKTAVRFTIAVPSECRSRLVIWRTLAAEVGVSRRAYRALDETGGYGARHWWVYRGIIEPTFIKSVEIHGQLVDPAADRSRLWDRRRVELRRLQDQLGTLPVDVALAPEEELEFGAHT